MEERKTCHEAELLGVGLAPQGGPRSVVSVQRLLAFVINVIRMVTGLILLGTHIPIERGVGVGDIQLALGHSQSFLVQNHLFLSTAIQSRLGGPTAWFPELWLLSSAGPPGL